MPRWTNDLLEGAITLFFTLKVPGVPKFAPFNGQREVESMDMALDDPPRTLQSPPSLGN